MENDAIPEVSFEETLPEKSSALMELPNEADEDENDFFFN